MIEGVKIDRVEQLSGGPPGAPLFHQWMATETGEGSGVDIEFEFDFAGCLSGERGHSGRGHLFVLSNITKLSYFMLAQDTLLMGWLCVTFSSADTLVGDASGGHAFLTVAGVCKDNRLWVTALNVG